MSNPKGDREQRKRALREARQKLAQRKREREALRNARANGMSIGSDSKNASSMSSSKQQAAPMSFFDDIDDDKESAAKPQSMNSQASLYRKARKKSKLSTSRLVDNRYAVSRRIGVFDKRVGTEYNAMLSHMKSVYGNEFDCKEKKEEIEMKSCLVQSVYKIGWPRELWMKERSLSPSPQMTNLSDDETEEQVYLREKLMKQENERKLRRQTLLNERKKKQLYRDQLTLLPEEEASVLLTTGDFMDNFKQKAQWMERTLGVNNVENMIANKKQKGGKNEYLTLIDKFSLPLVDGYCVGDIDFSNISKDWFLSSYMNTMNDSGVVLVWNMVLGMHEYKLHSPTMITSTKFHPSDPFLIFAASVSGQILSWDLRVRDRPVHQTNCNFQNGHCTPIFFMDFLPNLSAHNRNNRRHLLSVSNDSKVCIWKDDGLQAEEGPMHSAILSNDKLKKELQDSVNCCGFPSKHTEQCVFGSDSGNLYFANIHNQQSGSSLPSNDMSNAREREQESKETDSQSRIMVDNLIENAHFGPITNVSFNNTITQHTSSMDLFVSSSYDWTVKLWHKNNATQTYNSICTFAQMNDYVYDVKWAKPGAKPGVFACVDGDQKLSLFDLSRDFSEPVSVVSVRDDKTDIDVALTKVEWGTKSKHVCCGDSDGNVWLYRSDPDLLLNPRQSDFEDFEEAIRIISRPRSG